MAQSLLKQIWITEKTSRLASEGKYAFLVSKSAVKNEIAKQIENRYKVHVVKINVVNRAPKNKGSQRLKGKVSGYRKAIVTLKQGEKIDLE